MVQCFLFSAVPAAVPHQESFYGFAVQTSGCEGIGSLTHAVLRCVAVMSSSPCFVAQGAADPEFVQWVCALLLLPTAVGVA